MESIVDEIYNKISNIDTQCNFILRDIGIDTHNQVDEIMNPLWDDLYTEIYNNINTNIHNAKYKI